MPKNSWIVLAAFIVLCLAVGSVSGWLTADGVREWYPTLVKPSFNPPSWLFGPVWTVLYIMMAVAAWLVWRQTGDKTLALGLFFLQLAFNFLWSFIFFGLHNLGLALVDIVAMWLAIVATMWAFAKFDIRATWMMVPYLAWVSFATVLNFSLWQLN